MNHTLRQLLDILDISHGAHKTFPEGERSSPYLTCTGLRQGLRCIHRLCQLGRYMPAAAGRFPYSLS